MGQVCSVCSHPKKLQIDRKLAMGQSLASISREYSVSEDALRNHRDNHLSRQLMQAIRRKQATEGLDLLGKIDELIDRTKRILDTAEREKRLGLALGAIREVRGSYELLAKIAVVLHETRKEELEAEQMQSDLQQQEEYSKRLKILTTAELEFLMKINDKLERQDRKMIVIPDAQTDISIDFSTGNKLKRNKQPKKHNEQPEQSPQPSELLTDDSLIVRPIEPKQIPSTPTREVFRRLRNGESL